MRAFTSLLRELTGSFFFTVLAMLVSGALAGGLLILVFTGS